MDGVKIGNIANMKKYKTNLHYLVLTKRIIYNK
jgi:hypothetical protein